MAFSYINDIIIPCVSSIVSLPRTLKTDGLSIEAICNKANTFMFATMLISEIAELTHPERSLKARTALQPAHTLIGTLFLQDDIHELSNCKKYWHNEEYPQLISAIFDVGSDLSALIPLADYVGLLDMAHLAAKLGSVPVLKGLVTIGLDPICTTMGLIMKVCTIIIVCKEVKEQHKKGESISSSQKAMLIYSTIVIATKVTVITGAFFGWAPTATTLALFSISRTVGNFARAYAYNNY